MSREDMPGHVDVSMGAISRRNAMKAGGALAGGLALTGAATGTSTADVDTQRVAPQTSQMFLELEGIEGESRDHAHEGEIEVFGWSWGASNSGSLHRTRGGGAGRPSFQDITISKRTDRSTPALWHSLAVGRHIPSGSLVVRSAGGDEPVEQLRIDIEPVLVTDIATSGSVADDRAVEEVSLNFARFRLVYTPQDADGTPMEAVEMGFDITTNELL